MMHKRLMTPVIERLEPAKSAYFADLSETLATDPRIERNANLVFLFLAEAAPYLPVGLPKRDMIGRLIAFVERNQHRLMRTAYDPAFLTRHDLILPVVSEFVAETTAQVLQKFDAGEIDEEGEEIFRLKWPIDPDAFPYVDLDELDDEENG